MNTLITTIIIGVSLSMDAFSLSLIYGTQGISKRSKIFISTIVGIYHFIMPLLGKFLGTIINMYIILNLNVLVGIIFIIIGFQMIINSLKNEENKITLTIIGIIIFGFSVSLDSFSIGIGLNVINTNYIQAVSLFSLISGVFTYVGLNIGHYLNQKLGKIASIAGGIILLLLAIYYFIK